MVYFMKVATIVMCATLAANWCLINNVGTRRPLTSFWGMFIFSADLESSISIHGPRGKFVGFTSCTCNHNGRNYRLRELPSTAGAMKRLNPDHRLDPARRHRQRRPRFLTILLLTLLFPITISIFYFQFKKLFYAAAITAISLYTLYALNPIIHDYISPAGLVAVSAMFFVYASISYGVLKRGREILIHLHTSYQYEELLVRNILMDKLAKTDALTDTYNHMAYHENKENLVESADKGLVQMHLALFDIDNFKSINDTYGHRAGDYVLKKVAEIAKQKVGIDSIVARYGGEEFAVLFTETSSQDVLACMEEIRLAVADVTHEALQGRSVTISVGLNRYTPGMGKEALFQGADAALYRAKHSGKNRTVSTF